MQKLRPNGGKPRWIPRHQRSRNLQSKGQGSQLTKVPQQASQIRANPPVCSECRAAHSLDDTRIQEGGHNAQVCIKCGDRTEIAQGIAYGKEERVNGPAALRQESKKLDSAAESVQKLDSRLECLRQEAG